MDILSLSLIVAKVVVIFAGLMLMVAYMTLFERRIVAFIQGRKGPNRVGPQGLLQPLADALKLLSKEDVTPAGANKIIFNLAPVITFVPALLTIAVVPVADNLILFGREISMVISDINIGILFILAIASLGVYGIILGGWSSNSKYPLLGSLRSSAQMVSYEVALGLALVGLLMVSGSFSLSEIVHQQSSILEWNIIKQPLGFVLFAICALAESNRIPFDLPEAEAELVGGYNTEFSGIKFAMFFMAEYANIIASSAVITTLYFGGWQGPILPPIVWFLIKVVFFLFGFVWVRATLPRFRYDQLMRFGWLVLLPLALLNILITGIVLVL
ncbi:MAG: NADH-quinone oxidoreductase subunit NuoH [candidate division Zixibacteria bacterium CG_4_9_14_3_um_filter_46_8]|nr:MAG: NADH-quinone oxidoreductase subunit NuoH [candidate division Zixibacteria bacterium CG_4_9_14_3_um_filter_46_8]